MANTPIQKPRETWFITNVSNDSIRITDIPSIPVIKPNQRIDLLTYTDLVTAQSSTVIAAYISNSRLSSEEYLHTHDDKSEIGHTHELDEITDVTASPADLTQLTDESNADDLHKHQHNLLEGLNEDDYIHLTASNKIDFTILIDGSNADDLHTHDLAGNIDHDKLDNLQGGASDDYYHLKKTQHDTLTDGSDADALHTHDGKADTNHTHILSNVTDVTATSTEINQALDGIGLTVTDTNLNTLTDNSNADGLHSHSASGHPDHNDLNGLNVGDYQHLTSAEKTNFDLNTSKRHDELHTVVSHSDTTATGTELDNLTDGTNADALHVHGASGVTGLTEDEILFGKADGTIEQDPNLIWDGSTLTVAGDVSLVNNNDKLYFGDNQEASIYFDGTDLNITLNEPSQTGDINLTDNVSINGDATPHITNNYDLGTTDKRWNNLYYSGNILDTSGKILQERYVDRSLVNGTFRESFDFLADSDGAVVTASLNNQDNPSGAVLTMQFSDGDSELQVPSEIILTAGSNTSPQNNYIYIPISTKVLTQSDNNFPIDEEHIKIAYLLIPSAAHVQSDGTYINQNWNDELTDDVSGSMAHVGERIRYSGANYFSGIDPNGTDQAALASYYNDADASFRASSGIIYQMHRHPTPQFDSSTAQDDFHVVNWFGEAFRETNLFTDIVADSNGDTLANSYFNLFFFAVGNKTGEYAPFMCQLPSGNYNSRTSAENDVDGFDNLNMPREFNLDSSTGVPICRMTMRYTGGINTLTHISTVDLRVVGISGVGGTGLGTDFADNQFDIFNVTDNTKVIDFFAGNITAGNTRTITMADRDLDLANPIFTSVTHTGWTWLGATTADFTDSSKIIDIAPGDATSLTIISNTNNLLVIDTSGTYIINFGDVTTSINPAYNFYGDGLTTHNGNLTIDLLAIDQDAILTMDGFSNAPGTMRYESDNEVFIFDKKVTCDFGASTTDIGLNVSNALHTDGHGAIGSYTGNPVSITVLGARGQYTGTGTPYRSFNTGIDVDTTGTTSIAIHGIFNNLKLHPNSNNSASHTGGVYANDLYLSALWSSSASFDDVGIQHMFFNFDSDPTMNITNMYGLDIEDLEVAQIGSVTNAYAIKIGTVNGATSQNYGIKIGDVTGTGSFAIQTGAGDVMFGGSLDVQGNTSLFGSSLTVDASTITMIGLPTITIDNDTSAFSIIESAKNVFNIDSTTPEITLGNTTDNYAYNFDGTGLTTLGGNVVLQEGGTIGTTGQADLITLTNAGVTVNEKFTATDAGGHTFERINNSSGADAQILNIRRDLGVTSQTGDACSINYILETNSVVRNMGRLGVRRLADIDEGEIFFTAADSDGTRQELFTLNNSALTIAAAANIAGDLSLVNNNDKLYFGDNQEASIYFDGTDLNISLNEPSQTGDINLTDNVNIAGILTVGSNSIQIDGDNSTISSTKGIITIANDLTVDGKITPKTVSVTTIGELSTALSTSQSGTLIELATGTYDNSAAQLEIPSGVSLVGTGSGSVTINATFISNHVAGELNETTIKGITINSTDADTKAGHGMNEFTNGDFLLNDVILYSNKPAAKGNIITFAANVRPVRAEMINCVIYGGELDGISTKANDADYGAHSFLILRNCHSYDNGDGTSDQAFTTHDKFAATAYNCRFEAHQEIGVKSQSVAQATSAEPISLINCKCDGPIRVQYALGCHITISHTANDQDAISTNSGADALISGNIVNGNGTNCYRGINVEAGDGDHQIIQNNYLYNILYNGTRECGIGVNTTGVPTIDLFNNRILIGLRGIDLRQASTNAVINMVNNTTDVTSHDALSTAALTAVTSSYNNWHGETYADFTPSATDNKDIVIDLTVANNLTVAGTTDAGTSCEANAYTVGGAAGIDFSGAVTNITVVKGIITAAS